MKKKREAAAKTFAKPMNPFEMRLAEKKKLEQEENKKKTAAAPVSSKPLNPFEAKLLEKKKQEEEERKKRAAKREEENKNSGSKGPANDDAFKA